MTEEVRIADGSESEMEDQEGQVQKPQAGFHPTKNETKEQNDLGAQNPKSKPRSKNSSTSSTETIPPKMVTTFEKLEGKLEGELKTVTRGTGEPKRKESLDFETKLQAVFNDGAARRPSAKPERVTRPKLIYTNTYRMGPVKAFNREEVSGVIERTLAESLGGMKYSSSKASTVSCLLAETIRNRVLEFGYDRYKIVVFLNIGPKARQGVEIGMKCLWDPARDGHAHGTFESYHLFASAVVYGVYYE